MTRLPKLRSSDRSEAKQYSSHFRLRGLFRQPNAEKQTGKLGVRKIRDDLAIEHDTRALARPVNPGDAVTRFDIRESRLHEVEPALGLLFGKITDAPHLVYRSLCNVPAREGAQVFQFQRKIVLHQLGGLETRFGSQGGVVNIKAPESQLGSARNTELGRLCLGWRNNLRMR